MVSAGSKMQAHVFSWQSNGSLSHICKYSQQLFKNQNKTGKKEFGILTDVQDFRIMATALVKLDKEFLVAFGTSSGQLILERLDLKAKQLTQVDVKQH